MGICDYSDHSRELVDLTQKCDPDGLDSLRLQILHFLQLDQPVKWLFLGHGRDHFGATDIDSVVFWIADLFYLFIMQTFGERIRILAWYKNKTNPKTLTKRKQITNAYS